MESENIEKKHGMTCASCGMPKCGDMMGHGCFFKYRLLKKFFMLILLIVVFCFGMQLGELKTLSSIMYHSGGYNSGYNTGYNNMMNSY